MLVHQRVYFFTRLSRLSENPIAGYLNLASLLIHRSIADIFLLKHPQKSCFFVPGHAVPQLKLHWLLGSTHSPSECISANRDRPASFGARSNSLISMWFRNCFILIFRGPTKLIWVSSQNVCLRLEWISYWQLGMMGRVPKDLVLA